jgi:hypothetical protein
MDVQEKVLNQIRSEGWIFKERSIAFLDQNTNTEYSVYVFYSPDSLLLLELHFELEQSYLTFFKKQNKSSFSGTYTYTGTAFMLIRTASCEEYLQFNTAALLLEIFL